MPPEASVIIAALDEEPFIAGVVDSAFAAGAAEVILCDGGSRDATRELAAARGARVVACEPMRARQFNRGAALASHAALIFLHGDTRLPTGAADAVVRALEGGIVFGGFRLSFLEPAPKLRVAAAMINLRTAITRSPWGDQAQFISRDVFEAAGGFREIPLMEDYELAARMKRRGRTVVLPLRVVTSGRRFLTKGLWRTAMINWLTIARFRMGADPAELARRYRA